MNKGFLGFSYGFRPGRSAHGALDALAVAIERKKVNWVLDADIRAFFDTIDHAWMQKIIEHRIGDRRLVRLLRGDVYVVRYADDFVMHRARDFTRRRDLPRKEHLHERKEGADNRIESPIGRRARRDSTV